MQKAEKLTLDETAFYYTKLHDFNNDGGLDGLELMLAIKHSLQHSNLRTENLEDLAGQKILIFTFSHFLISKLIIFSYGRFGIGFNGPQL